MLELRVIHGKEEIINYLRNKDLGNFMYHSCNIDPNFWPYTQFYGLYEGEKLMATAMLSLKYEMPVLLATSYCLEDSYQTDLVKKIKVFLPQEIYSHLNRGDGMYLAGDEKKMECVPFYNMKYTGKESTNLLSEEEIHRLNQENRDELITFFEKSHPHYMIDDQYLEEGYYYGMRKEGKLISVAGVFSIATQLKVAQIGNVATHPEYRNQGLAQRIIIHLMGDRRLKEMQIVLNVRQDNRAAIHTYEKLGFEIIGEFDEVTIG